VSTRAARLGRRTATIIGRAVVVVLWLLAFVVAGATGLEFLLRIRSHWLPPYAPSSSGPRHQQLLRAYAPFGFGHLHPQYFFFFPLDPRERVAISNETCSIDADGFRGPGPAHVGGRRLAFLLGGSSAFGDMASSDATTITGYLNRLQNEYFFVNAGVPGWGSTQEMFRVAFQILDYRPALVVTYDGANDAEIVVLARDNLDSVRNPIGSRGDFEALAAFVDGRRSTEGWQAAAAVSEYLFPELKHRIDARLEMIADSGGAAPVASAVLLERVLQEGAARYLSNLGLIRDLTTARGARFIAVFQPVAHLHRHLAPGLPLDAFARVDEFHRTVMAQYAHDFEFHDLASVFDPYFASIPVRSPDITDATIFADELHLYDPGNEIVARELSRIIQ
jgi:hypothetical protein